MVRPLPNYLFLPGQLESMKAVAALETPPRYQPRSAADDALRFARTCYDHLAGRLGVTIADAMVRKKYGGQ